MRIKDAYITTSNFYSKNDDLFNKKVRSLMKSKKEFNIASLSFGNDKGMISSSSNILTSGVNKKNNYISIHNSNKLFHTNKILNEINDNFNTIKKDKINEIKQQIEKFKSLSIPIKNKNIFKNKSQIALMYKIGQKRNFSSKQLSLEGINRLVSISPKNERILNSLSNNYENKLSNTLQKFNSYNYTIQNKGRKYSYSKKNNSFINKVLHGDEIDYISKNINNFRNNNKLKNNLHSYTSRKRYMKKNNICNYRINENTKLLKAMKRSLEKNSKSNSKFQIYKLMNNKIFEAKNLKSNFLTYLNKTINIQKIIRNNAKNFNNNISSTFRTHYNKKKNSKFLTNKIMKSTINLLNSIRDERSDNKFYNDLSKKNNKIYNSRFSYDKENDDNDFYINMNNNKENKNLNNNYQINNYKDNKNYLRKNTFNPFRTNFKVQNFDSLNYLYDNSGYYTKRDIILPANYMS